MPRGRKTEHGETIHTRVVHKLRHEAQIESWAWRWAHHRVRHDWQQHAACRDTDTEQWFCDDRSRRTELFAICNECPVRLDCGREAIENEDRNTSLVHGVRAGFGPFDRLKAAYIYDRLKRSA